MRIVKRHFLGFQPVYDIGLAGDHNFLLANGAIASNCFNKSHSVAYGYLTYQTAYLKANYPVEYMAALLSSVSGDHDKVQKYISNCLSLGITVLPPDINRSGVDFTPHGKDILCGLAAIKNLGLGAIEAILSARAEGGAFSSLADLCLRVDSRALNRKALEALIQAGAMDSILPNRHQLMADLEVTLEWVSRRARERAVGQGNLFDLFSGNSDLPSFSAPQAPPVPDYSPSEKLQFEKELLGFYVSHHPLKEVSSTVNLLSPVNLGELGELSENASITAIALITEIKEITTKKGERMAILQIEDLTGSASAVVFPKTYHKVRAYLAKNNRLMVWGRIDRREEEKNSPSPHQEVGSSGKASFSGLQIIVDDMQPVEEVQLLQVQLTPAQASDLPTLHRLREILKRHASDKDSPVKVPVVANLQYTPKFVRFGNQFWVRDVAQAIADLAQAGFSATASRLLPTVSP
jgi:DNA polymerase-3 subunit alpha